MGLYIGITVIVLLAALFLFLIWPATRRHPDRQWLPGRYIAHRGVHSLDDRTPENSLPAFQKAVEHGWIIENDIHITADGEVVVFHDDTTKRMCGVDRRIEDMTLAEIKELRLGQTEETIPTLQECLDLVDGKVPLLIEFKCDFAHYRSLCEAANKILSNYHGKYLMQSFYPYAVQWYKKNRPDICRGQLATAFKGEGIVRRAAGCLLFNVLSRPDFVSYDHKEANHPCRRLCTKLGAYPIGWTFRSQEELNAGKSIFKTYIFDLFLPKGEEDK